MKNIIITGTSRGIGYQLALQFANAGNKVLALSRTISEVLSNHENIDCLSVDLASADGLNQVIDFIELGWKHVDVLIHNAGALVLKPFADITAEDFEYIYRVNVFGVAALNRAILPFMGKGGHVVTISSMGGVQGTMKFAGLAAYSSSKGAVITLSELLAEEYKEQGIAFNVLALGAVNTEMLQEAFPGYEAPLTAAQIADYIYNFALTGNVYFNGKVLQVSSTTP
ncbi:SDR family NAD(P)-dependent oxidoreductase [Flavobacterium sp. Sd200]|uniref:SDR family NAD(P)-dependent oxidoreductase n=1 Tax=Flavobacterium sp. Sd200 TaxID=2692211 RepID=UPI00136C3750|nr:SDR family oxidoreductase [Flavobacterium sp. Sd200]MXN90885.1 SDR family NAD(P)-dependent oxidoreductase [Flavobacterium sp. Sd200]